MYGALARIDVPSRSAWQLKVPKAFKQMLLYLRAQPLNSGHVSTVSTQWTVTDSSQQSTTANR